jgi:hypothetical protein
MWKYYIAGIAPSLVYIVISAIQWGFYDVWGLIIIIIFTLPFGLLAGFVGHMVAKAKSKQPPQVLRDVVISFILGILFLVAGLYLYARVSCC